MHRSIFRLGLLGLFTGLAVGTLALALDTDQDGMDDAYETLFGLDPDLPADADRQDDGDSLTNRQEAALWTDPFETDTDQDGWNDGVDQQPLSRAVMMWGQALFTDGDTYVYTGPSWWLGAHKDGGTWSNESWNVDAAETNPAALYIDLDRTVLTNAVRMDITLLDRAGAGLETDLLDSEGTEVATNLHGNLLSGTEAEVVRRVSVDLPAQPLGASVRLRRTSGAVTVYETMIYVDGDDDELDREQEAQLGTSDHLADSDGDGYRDRYEHEVGTDPLNAADLPPGPIYLKTPPAVVVACGAEAAPDVTGVAYAYHNERGSPELTETGSTEDLAQGRVAHWRFDEAPGATQAASTTNANLVGVNLQSVGLNADGRVGRSYYFKGTNSSVLFGNPALLNFTGTVTLAAWIRPEATNGLRNIMAHGYQAQPAAEVALRINAGQYQVGSANGTNYFASAPIPPGDVNQWIHLAGTYDGTTWRLYRNGAPVASVASPVGALAMTNKWAIGAHGTGLERFFKGNIDEVAVWKRSLGAREVAALYTHGAQGVDVAHVVQVVQRTWAATNAFGWSAHASQEVVRIADAIPPTLIMPATHITVDCAGGLSPYTLGSATAVDNCDPAPLVTFSDGVLVLDENFSDGMANSGAWYSDGSKQVWAGSAGAISRQLNPVYDHDLNPSTAAASLPGGIEVLDTVISNTLRVRVVLPPSVSAGSVATLSFYAANRGTVGVPRVGVTNVTDGRNLLSPTAIAFTSGGSNWNYKIHSLPLSASDANDTLEIRFSDSANNGHSGLHLAAIKLFVGTPAEASPFGPSVIERTWTATDAAGNSRSDVQRIALLDTTAPVLVKPVNVAVNCTGSTEPAATGYATATDGCDGAPTVTYSNLVRQTHDALLAALALDEPPFATAAADDSGRGVTGRVAGAQTGEQGMAGRSCYFNGTSDYLDLGTEASIGDAGDFTVSAWVKTTDADGGYVLSQRDTDYDGYNDGYFFGINSSGRPFFNLHAVSNNNYRSVSATNVVNDGQWHHLLGQRLGASSLKIYVDGLLAGTAASFSHSMLGTVSTFVGANKRENSEFLGGWIDDVAIWHAALSSGEVSMLYVRGLYAGESAASLDRVIDRTWKGKDRTGNSVSGTQLIIVGDFLGPVLTAPSNAVVASSDAADPAHTGYATASDTCDAAPVVTWVDSDNLLSAGLRAHYELDESIGATGAVDTSGSGGVGTHQNALAGQAGVRGGAYYFNGTNAAVRLGDPSPLSFTGQLTVAVWARAEATDGLRNLVTHGPQGSPSAEVALRINDGRYEMGMSTTSNLFASAVIPSGDSGRWVHVVGTCSGSVWRIYRNGQEVGEAVGAEVPVLAAEWALGSRGSGTDRFFKGRLDEVALWDRALGADEVQYLYELNLRGGTLVSPSTAPSLSVRREWTARDHAGHVTGAHQDLTLAHAMDDVDGDGLNAAQEHRFGSDPSRADTDGDGLSDYDEALVHYTNPSSADTDGDGLDDQWEVAQGTDPLVADAAADPDGDGLANILERLAGTDPHVADTDGDGVDDFVEVCLVASDPLSIDFDGTTTVLQDVSGLSATNRIGEWDAYGDSIFSLGWGGTLDYPLVAPTAGYYAVEAVISQFDPDTASNQTFSLLLSVDGRALGEQEVGVGFGDLATPFWIASYLEAGDHTASLHWRYEVGDGSLRVVAVRLVTLGGPDLDSNGRPDWLDQRLHSGLQVDAQSETSYVSPICYEGRSVQGATVAVTNDYAPPGGGSAILVRRGILDTWYANVPLSPTGLTAIAAHGEFGADAASNVVTWVPCNVFQPPTNPLVIRQGDALLFDAHPAGITAGVFRLQLIGLTNYAGVAGTPVAHAFTQRGEYIVQASWSNGAVNAATQLTVTVVGASFGPAPIIWLGRTRTWLCADLPEAAALETDPRMSIAEYHRSAGRELEMDIDAAATRCLVARLGRLGPVLASTELHGVDLQSNELDFPVVQEWEDGTKLVRMTVRLEDVFDGLRVQIELFTGSIYFADGSTVLQLQSSDFNAQGEATVYFVVMPGWQGGVCHRLELFQDDELVGER